MYDFGEFFEKRMSDMEARYQVLSDQNDKEPLRGLALHYFIDLGYMLKRVPDLVWSVQYLEQDNQRLVQELNEKTRVTANTKKETHMEPMSWDDLCGERTLMAIQTDVRHPFEEDANGVALGLGGDLMVFVFENPSDGYRSMAIAPLVAKASLYEFGVNIHFNNLQVPVRITRWTKTENEYTTWEANGLEFTDTRNGKVVLRVGTDYEVDYYPTFVCDWRPQDLAEQPG